MEKRPTIFARATERGVSWKDQAYYEGYPVETIQKAEEMMIWITDLWQMEAHNQCGFYAHEAEAIERGFLEIFEVS